jgi:hypothetical protein
MLTNALPTPIEISTCPDTTATWNTYINTANEFAVKYPKKTAITITQIDAYIKNLPYQFEVKKGKSDSPAESH